MRRCFWCLSALVLAAGCKPEWPMQDPLDYLATGVEPEEEADRVALQLGRAGYVVDTRVSGGGAVALSARRLRDQATAFRLVTSRGMVLGIDVPDARFPERTAVRLPHGAYFSRREMDGHFEISLEVITHVRCLAVLVVDYAGFVRELSRGDNPHPNEGCYPEPEEEEDEEIFLEEGDEIIDGANPGSFDAPDGG